MRLITDRERSALLRMAGNIAGGLAQWGGATSFREDEQETIAKAAVAIALFVFEDERLTVRTGLPAEER